jgi:hypothetical protein
MRTGGLLAATSLTVLVLAAPASAAPPKDFTVIGKTVDNEVNEDNVRFDEKIYESVKGPKVGKARFRCEFDGRDSSCTAQFRLRDGSILAKGRLGEVKARVPGENQASTIAIRGGTGRYRNAKGKLIFNAITRRLTQERFNFR